MKRNVFTLLFLLLSLVVSSQTIIDKPNVGFSTAPYVNITKVVLSDTATIIHFQTKFEPGNWIFIPQETFIKPVDGGEQLFVKSADGIPLGGSYTMPKSGEVIYSLTFPAIDKSVVKLDYGEANSEGSWFIFDIHLKPVPNNSGIPQALFGNWLNKSTGDLGLCLFDTAAVYKNQLWSYGEVKSKKSLVSVLLKNSNATVELFIKNGKDGLCEIGESPKALTAHCNSIAMVDKGQPTIDKPYDLPVFTIDSATYCGYIKGYTPRIGVKTFSIHIDNTITGNQNTYVVTINPNGYFSIKVPFCYPHTTYVRSPFYNGSVFLEPGKVLFQIIDSSNRTNPLLFMGESAKINTDLLELASVDSFDYYDMQRRILDMTPAMYKEYCLKIYTKDTKTLDSIASTNTIGAKAYQVQQFDLLYRKAINLMDYGWNFECAYRAKNKIPRTQRTLPIKIDSLTADYFDFITNDITNNPIAVISVEYGSYINRLKYLDILRNTTRVVFTTSDLILGLEKSGYSFNDSEKAMIEKWRELEVLKNSPAEKEFAAKYETRNSDFNKKYQDLLQPLYKSSSNVDNAAVEKYLIEKKVKLTDDEMQLLAIRKEHDKSEAVVKSRLFFTTYGEELKKFSNSQQGFVNAALAKKEKDNYENKLKDILGVQPGFATDIMMAQKSSRKIVEESTPVSDAELKAIQQQIATPFIADYMALCNQQTLAKLDANKLKTGYTVNNVPKAEGDKLFDAIMEKYKGKVVYVDFWATWCAPCRSGIERIQPLKDEMADKNVAFVYITNQSSPENTWSNMIPDIKGEHYRLSADEWNYLSAKFNISGIPHYVLVGKDGTVINPALGHFDNQSLKSEFEKHL